MIVVYKEMKDGKVQLTKQELEELLNKARQEGPYIIQELISSSI